MLADALGRKTVILAADVLFVVGALWQAWTSSVWGMIAGRSVVGAAVGSASFVVPLYIGELAPGPWRGRMVTISSLFITGGQVVAYIIGWWFSEKAHGWRWMVGIGALPALVQFVMLFLGMPETPRYLAKAGQKEKARRVLMKVYEGSEGVDAKRLVNSVLRRVERDIMEEEDVVVGGSEVGPVKQGWAAKVQRVQQNFAQLVGIGGNRRALIIACMLQGAQQLCGFVSPTISPIVFLFKQIRPKHVIRRHPQSMRRYLQSPNANTPPRTPSCTSPPPSSPSSASAPQPSPPSPSQPPTSSSPS